MTLARLRRRRSARFAWMVLLALLFQQVALAAYACPVQAPAARQVAMADCHGMKTLDQAAPVLCDQHCNPDHPATPDLRAAQVPPVALPPPHFNLLAWLMPATRSLHYRDVPTCRSDPPAAERFCSLQL